MTVRRDARDVAHIRSHKARWFYPGGDIIKNHNMKSASRVHLNSDVGEWFSYMSHKYAQGWSGHSMSMDNKRFNGRI